MGQGHGPCVLCDMKHYDTTDSRDLQILSFNLGGEWLLICKKHLFTHRRKHIS